jgi:hypothetical protein
MRRTPPFLAALSCLAIALVAAAISDPLVELVSNTGIFGPAFVDHDQQSVATVLVAGIVLGLVFLVARFGFGAANDQTDSRDWLRGIALRLSKTSSFGHVVPIFAAQIAIVYAMEMCEQLLAPGAAISGLSWLGGPVVFSLPMHLAVCLLCVYVIRHVARALLPGVITAICDVLERIILALARDAVCGHFLNSREQRVCHAELTAAQRIRGRAPPSIPAFV